MDKIKDYLQENSSRLLLAQKEGTIKWGDEEVQILKAKGVKTNREVLRNRFKRMKSSGEVDVSSVAVSVDETENWKIKNQKDDVEKGERTFDFTADKIPTEQEIIDHFGIDTTRYRIAQIWHKTTPSGRYSISVNIHALHGNKSIVINDKFAEQVAQIISKPLLINSLHLSRAGKKPRACLLIPKQDAHWNKSDVRGNNSIEERFSNFVLKLVGQLDKIAQTNDLDAITYVIGSDEFNAEWTGGTTKGTPQQNILSYNKAFEKISEFNIETIKLLKSYASKVDVVLLNGNHDHNVSWHLAHLLKHVFGKADGIYIDDSLENTKIASYYSSLVCLNHGDAIKSKDLAAKFPIIAKDKWSQHSNYYVISGDKHHEVAHDYHGVMWYQVPQLSNSISNWDNKMGFITSKAELLTFLFEEQGLTNILRNPI